MAQQTRIDIADVIETQTNWWFSISTLLVCCLAMMADGFDNQAINYTSPAIIRDWGIEPELMTIVFNSNILGWMTGALMFSMIADQIGRRNATIFAVLLFGGFTYAISFVTNLWELSVLKFLASVGVGGAMPMAIALISDYTPSKRRGLMITALFLGYTCGSSGGGFLAAELIGTYGWQSVFQIGGILGLVSGAVLLFTLPESVRYLLVRGAPQDKIVGYVRKMKPNVAIAPDTEFVIKETKKQKGVPLRFLLSDGRAAMSIFLWLALGFSFVTHFFISNWLSILLAEHMPIEDAVRTKALFQFGAAFGIAFGWLIDRKGVPVVTWTKLIGFIPVASIGFFVDAGVGVMMLLALAAGIFVLGGTIGLNAISGMIYPTFIRSTGTGAAFAVARIGAMMGPPFGGLLIYLETPIEWIFILGAVPMLLSGLTAYGLSRTVDVRAVKAASAGEAGAAHGHGIHGHAPVRS